MTDTAQSVIDAARLLAKRHDAFADVLETRKGDTYENWRLRYEEARNELEDAQMAVIIAVHNHDTLGNLTYSTPCVCG